ncbi:MAG: ABC transporter ATP-binding protein [Coriobacteriia bacterium]|nr:ABC transporter ATP-binding protein [Coriobacteriia bacterium]MCL2536730.1 ABC transporter ATP-binding protein [Coriobacteriia bacterium]
MAKQDAGLSQEIILEVRNLTKRFPGIVACDNISLDIRKGEIYALLGENGAGKSTLASMIFGLYQPDEGQIYIRGQAVSIDSPNEAVALDIGMVHQHFKLVSNYTVAENIILGDEPRKKALGLFPYVDIKSAEARIEQLSRDYGLEVDPRAVIHDLGVSTQQRVEILKMLYRDAEILIFDEPTAMLTPQEIESLLQIIKNLRDQGKTVIFITHKLDEVMEVCDRCAILVRGKLVDISNTADTSPRELASKMVGRDIEFSAKRPTKGMGDTILEVEGLRVEDANGFPKVNDVSFKVHAGEIFAVAGVSGSGQTELADAIAGLAKTKKGDIKLKGHSLSKMNVRKRSEDGIAYIPEDRQSVGLVLDFCLDQNLALKSYYRKPYCKTSLLKPVAFSEHAKGLIDDFDIRCARGPKTITREMSGGNQQKAIVGREIDQGADLLIFVQPTRGLDIGAIMAIRERILDERDKGKAVLLISLELDEVMDLADTIGVMYAGQMLKVAAAADLSMNQVGEFMMGVTGNE